MVCYHHNIGRIVEPYGMAESTSTITALQALILDTMLVEGLPDIWTAAHLNKKPTLQQSTFILAICQPLRLLFRSKQGYMLICLSINSSPLYRRAAVSQCSPQRGAPSTLSLRVQVPEHGKCAPNLNHGSYCRTSDMQEFGTFHS